MVRHTGAPRSALRAGPSYPPYPVRTGEKARKRTFAWLTVDRRHNAMVVTDEYGTNKAFSLAEYAALRDMALDSGWCLFARFTHSAQMYPFLRESLHDQCATLLATRGKVIRGATISGVAWRRGNKHARVVDPDSWGYSQIIHEGSDVSITDFLHSCRRLCDTLGVGDYDTPASLGKAAVQAGWGDRFGLRKLWILPASCRALIRDNPTHPRIYDVTTPAVYGLLRERDLRTAYACALARVLPIGQPCYVTQGEATSYVVRGSTSKPSEQVAQTGICLGTWRIEVPETITYGPVSRIWACGQSPSFSVEQGTYQLPLWGEEANALAECGCTLEWLGGYLWLQTGAPFRELIDDLTKMRREADRDGNPILSEFIKRVPNCTVGGFKYTDSTTLVPEDRAVEGDLLFPLDWSGHGIPDELAALHVDSREVCVPEQWYSYIVMMVGLQIWRAQREETAKGYTVVSANVDSYRVVQPTLSLAPLEDSATWKEFLIRKARVKATRHIDGYKSSDGGQTWERMIRAPGVRRA